MPKTPTLQEQLIEELKRTIKQESRDNKPYSYQDRGFLPVAEVDRTIDRAVELTASKLLKAQGEKQLSPDTIQIAITAIRGWQKQVQQREGRNGSPRFFSDTNKAKKELKKLQKTLTPKEDEV